MRRFTIAIATAMALSVSTMVAVVGLSTPAFAASKVSCSTLTGTATGTVNVTKCAPSSTSSVSVSGASSSLLSGGIITWSPSQQTSIIKLNVKSPGRGKCGKGSTEEDAKGSVTGGTSTYTHTGDQVAIKACFAKVGGKLSLVKGSKALL
jgi:hypothetical protein